MSHDDASAQVRPLIQAIHALKSPPPAGSRHYCSGWDDALEAAMDAVRDTAGSVSPSEKDSAICTGRFPDTLPAGPAPATGRDALRDRIAEALYEARKNGLGGMSESAAVTYMANAVAQKLPATVDRAAVLREAADHFDRMGRTVLAASQVRDELCRLAGDALPAPTDQTAAERDSLGREADRLRKDWVEMRARAERAEAERDHLAAAASPADVAVRAIQLMQETGRERDAFATGLREARATNQRLNLRAQRLASRVAAYRRAVERVERVERAEAELLRLAGEPQQDEASDDCTCAAAGEEFRPAGHYRDCPEYTREAQQDEELSAPPRSDAFEQWLIRLRDEWKPAGGVPWQILDVTLLTYRVHAANRK